MKTVVVLIGNSDGKLAQYEWAEFAAQMDTVIGRSATKVHFEGGSAWDAPRQNACWVAEVPADRINALLTEVTEVGRTWRQESAAVLTGDTVFV
jgi:hypothetical protein